MERRLAAQYSGNPAAEASAGCLTRQPRWRGIAKFEFDRLGRHFDFALAHSLFTHLIFNRIRRCLERLAPVTKIGGHLFATFFKLPRTVRLSLPYTDDPSDIVTYDTRDPCHCKLADFFYAASGLPWQIRYIGRWGYPRGRRMLEFIRT